MGRCLWEMHKIAASVRGLEPNRTLRGGYMTPGDGKNCYCWKERAAK